MGIGSALRRVVGIGAETRAHGADSLEASPAQGETDIGDAPAEQTREADSGDAETHARRLLRWFQESEGATGKVLSRDIRAAYIEMCAELDWVVLAWHRVGEFFSALCGPKSYTDVIDEKGKRRRLLAYYLPRPGEVFSSPEAREKHPSAPIPQRLNAIETAIQRLADSVETLADRMAVSAGREASDVASAGRVVPFDRGNAGG